MKTKSKDAFVEEMKEKTKKFAIDVIRFCNALKPCKASDVITFQLVKSSASTGANYRAVCRARSRKEFFSKLCIVVEEIDESKYWLEVIRESHLAEDFMELERLIQIADECSKIMGKAKDSTYKSLH